MPSGLAAAQVAPAAQAEEMINVARFLLFAAAHIPIAYAMRHFGTTAATIHALGSLVVILVFSVSRPIQVLCYGAAYIVGAEVLWRMNSADIFWEFGKYAVALILIVGLFRTGCIGRPNAGLLYFALLVPSTFIPFMNVPWAWARQEASFNMSGPLVLMLSVWFFAHVRVSREEVVKILLFLLMPIVGISFLGVETLRQAGQIAWTDESNFMGSGGYAPNQVATVLGLGALLSFLVIMLTTPKEVKLRFAMAAAAVFFAAQSALTFSRGGLYAAAAGFIGSGFFFLQSPRARARFLVVSALIFLVAAFVVFPRLNAFTEGKLLDRFQDADPGGRAGLMSWEIELWKENPLLGVGPGKTGPYLSGRLASRPAPHTEFSRMLGEHGVLGLLAMVVILYMAFRLTANAPSAKARAITVGLGLWTAMTMMSAAMRLAAPGFIFGLAAAQFMLDDYLPPRGAAARR